MIHLVLLSGGSGTRLWPLSNSSRSKQFLKVLRDNDGHHVSMVQRVFAQIHAVQVPIDITIATCANQKNALQNQIGDEYALVLEPERRDTAPAIMLACAHLALEQKASPEDTVIVMPIDSYVDQTYYDGVTCLDRAIQEDFSDLVLMGVQPTYPSEKYGYIVPSMPTGSPRVVERFVEKPDEAQASHLIAQGALWNCGVFAFKLRYLIDLTNAYLSEDTFEAYRTHYDQLPKNSFDFEVVERAKSIGVIPYAGPWKDLGTWNTLTEEMADETSGRVVLDETSCENVHVINETGLPLVVAGLTDSVVVATPDGILVSSKDASGTIKRQINEAAEQRPMYEQQDWGEYRVIDNAAFPDVAQARTRELVIHKHALFEHQQRDVDRTIWTVLSGSGSVQLDGCALEIHPGSVVTIERESICSVHAVERDLHIIEVQLDMS